MSIAVDGRPSLIDSQFDGHNDWTSWSRCWIDWSTSLKYATGNAERFVALDFNFPDYLVGRMFKPEYEYKKAGIRLGGISPQGVYQAD